MDSLGTLNDFSTGIFNTASDFAVYIKNIPSYLLKSVVFIKNFIVSIASFYTSALVVCLVCIFAYIIYKYLNVIHRPWGMSNFLEISREGSTPLNMDILFYKSLAKGLANYIYNNKFTYNKNVLKINENNLEYINNKIFFHQNTNSYKQLIDFENKYNNIIYNKNWNNKSIEGIQLFFEDVLMTKYDIKKFSNIKKKLIAILKDPNNRKEFKTNLQKIVDDNIYSYINVSNYINNNPETDYILNTYGKFVKIPINSNTNDNKYLLDVLNIQEASNLNNILKYDSKTNETNITLSLIKSSIKEYNDISGQTLETYIFRTINGTEDNSDYLNYIQFIKEYGTSGNPNIDAIYKLNKIPQLSSLNKDPKLNLSRQSLFNIDVVDSVRKLKLLIYQDIIIYKNFIDLLNKKISDIINDPIKLKFITKTCNWHLERLAYAKYHNGETVVFLFDQDKIQRFIKINNNIIDLINYPIYKTEMSYGLFSILYIYLSNNNDLIKEKLQLLANFYMSFSEIFLATENIETFETLKGKRENVNLFEEFVSPAIKYYFTEIIFNGQIANIIWKNHYKEVGPLWNNFRTKMSHGSTYFDCANPLVFANIPVCKEKFKNKKKEEEKEKFKNEYEDEDEDEDEDENKDKDVIEKFSMKSAFKQIGDFFKMIGDFFKAVFKLIGDLFKFFLLMLKVLFGVIKLMGNFDLFLAAIAGFIIWQFFSWWLIILNLGITRFSKEEERQRKEDNIKDGQHKMSIGRLLFSFFYRACYLLPVAVFNSCIFMILILFRILITLISIVLDAFTNRQASRAFYSWFLACESSPFAWFENSFFQLGNNVEKSSIFCKKACPEGYKISVDGKSCDKIPNYIPKYCPQAELMRIYKGQSISGSYNLGEFSLPYGLTEEEKEQYIKEFKQNKKDYYESCQNSKMYIYDNVAKSICSTMELSKNSDIAQKDMKDICYNKFCKNGNHESFCTKLNYLNNDGLTNLSYGDYSFIKTITNYCIVIIVLVIAIYLINKKIDIYYHGYYLYANIKNKILPNSKIPTAIKIPDAINVTSLKNIPNTSKWNFNNSLSNASQISPSNIDSLALVSPKDLEGVKEVAKKLGITNNNINRISENGPDMSNILKAKNIFKKNNLNSGNISKITKVTNKLGIPGDNVTRIIKEGPKFSNILKIQKLVEKTS